MAFYNNVIAGAAGAGSAGPATDFQISKSLRFNQGDSSYLSKTTSSEGNRRTWTLSFWIKRSKIGDEQMIFSAAESSSNRLHVYFPNDDYIAVYSDPPQTGVGQWYMSTSTVARDPSAWMHLVFACDTTQSTATDRFKIYVNGALATDFTNRVDPPQYHETPVNSTILHQFSGRAYNTADHFDGYLAEVHFVDGQQLAPTDFGAFDSNNVWQPKKFNHGTAKHTGDWVGDTVGTPYGSAVNGSDKAFDGNDSTGAAPNTGTAFVFTPSTPITGISKVRIRALRDTSQSDDDGFQLNGTEIGSNWTAGAAVSEVEITVLNLISLRWETNSISHWYKVYKIEIFYDGAYHTLVQGDINSFNLDFKDTTTNQALGYDASVDSPARNNRGGFDAITYSGTGSARTVKGLAFQPDLVWVKRRNSSGDHQLYDSVRGIHKGLSPDQNVTEWEYSTGLTSFDSDGFSVGSLGGLNGSGDSHIAWAWKAGGPAVSNTDGSITSQVSASDEYGFSICTFTGTGSNGTFGHGLSTAPSLVIVKSTSNSQNWAVQHASEGPTKYSYLHSTNAFSSTGASAFWNDTAPTNSVVNIGSDNDTNASGYKYVAYCWSEVSGFSKFGSYSGGTNPKTVTTGFKPRFLLIKRSDTANHWMLIDSKRGGTQKLGADTNVAENNNATLGDASQNIVEFLDDGFKLTTTNAGTNTSGGTYVYAAFGDRAGNNWTTSNLQATAGLETAKQGMDVVTYTGTGSTQSITGLNFQPDFVWIKGRSAALWHNLIDSVRGNNKILYSNATNAEQSEANASLTSFNSNGFTLSSNGSTGVGNTNGNGTTYVAFCWKAGGSPSSNSDGSITSSVSANNTYGFSIATYTGTGSNATVGHGLNSIPKFIIVKRRDGSANWQVYHGSRGATEYGALNTTEAFTSSGGTTRWNDTAPTSSVFTVGTAGTTNGSSNTYVAYCWSEISGFSSFSSYTGTGAAGNKVTTGFKPRFVLVKRTTSISGSHMGWVMIDSERGYDKRVSAQDAAEENDGPINAAVSPNDDITFQDDGFTLASGGSATNGNTETYVYAAFADKPPGEIIDSLIDTPTDITADSGNNPGNYATLNPLNTNTNQTLSDGNLKCAATANQWGVAPATIAITSGKYYFESTLTGNNYHYIGIANKDSTILDSVTSTNDFWGKTSNDWGYQSGGTIIHNGGNLGWGTQTSYGTGDVVALAFDADTKTTKWYKNGTQIHTGTISGSAPFFVGVGAYGSGSFSEVNFGQRPFAYTPPTGYKSLCTTNLPDPTIAAPSTAFDTKLWDGNGGNQTISGLGFSPDLVWGKCRSHGGTSYHLTDAVRGANKSVFSNGTNAEVTYTNYLTAFTSDGFTLGDGSELNYSSRTFVGWAWDAGSSNTSISVGGLNSSAYDQSQTWSTYGSFTGTTWSPAVGTLFNGSLSDGPSLLAGQTGTYTFSSGITASNSIEIYAVNGSNANQRVKLTVDGTVHDINGAGNTWINTGLTGSLTAITIQVAGGWGSPGLRAIKVDGRMLVDNGTSVTNVPTIASTVRANPSAGFSIVTGSGNSGTVGHGLNATPDLVIVKQLNGVVGWAVTHSALGTMKDSIMYLNGTGGNTNSSNFWGSDNFDSSVFPISSNILTSGATFVAYCFTAVSGYSSFGKYTGNGSADGPFVQTGFRPKFLLIKNTSYSGHNWVIFDTERNTYNLAENYLAPNTSNSEYTDLDIDILSNGFKIRTAGGTTLGNTVNYSTAVYITAAFAEHPFKTARAR